MSAFEIKNRWTAAVLWSGTAESVKDAVEQADLVLLSTEKRDIMGHGEEVSVERQKAVAELGRWHSDDVDAYYEREFAAGRVTTHTKKERGTCPDERCRANARHVKIVHATEGEGS